MADYDLCRVGGDAPLADAHAVRQSVFIDEQDVPEAIEMDGKDGDAIHFVGYDTEKNRPVGTARLRVVDVETAKIERVAVRAEHRSRGLGKRLMETVEDEARKQGCTRVRLHAQTSVESFYHALGYETASDRFEQAGIPHVEMIKAL